MESHSDSISDANPFEHGTIFRHVYSAIDQIGVWIEDINTARREAVLYRLGDTLDGRIWLEKSSQVEGGLSLCLGDFRMVLNALYTGCTSEDHVIRPVGYLNRRPDSFQSRVNTLYTIKDFLFHQYLDFQIVVQGYYSRTQDMLPYYN
jgi:hypothetical protein